jgi:hypothetical protein
MRAIYLVGNEPEIDLETVLAEYIAFDDRIAESKQRPKISTESKWDMYKFISWLKVHYGVVIQQAIGDVHDRREVQTDGEGTYNP